MERMGFSIAFTQLAATEGLDEGVKGRVLSAFFYGYALMQVPGGIISSRVGGRRVLMASFTLWGVVSGLMPSNLEGGSPWIIVACRVAIGLSQGVIVPASHTVLAGWIPVLERGRLVSLAMSGMYLGSALSMLVVPRLVKKNGPGAEFNLAGLLALSWLMLWSSMGRDPPERAALGSNDKPVEDTPRMIEEDEVEQGGIHLIRQHSLTETQEEKSLLMTSNDEGVTAQTGAMLTKRIPWGVMIRSSAVWAIVSNNFGFHYGTYVLMSWMPTYFQDLVGVSLHEMGPTLKAMPYVMMFLSSNVGGWLGSWLISTKSVSIQYSRKLVNTLGFLIAGASMLVMPRAKMWWEGMLYATMVQSGLGLSRGGWSVNHMDIAPRHAGVLSAISNGAGTVAGVIGVALTGEILEATGGATSSTAWTCAMAVAAGVSMTALALFTTFARGEVLFP
ncbi:unnamed protein product [Choristocarpus tenellus]